MAFTLHEIVPWGRSFKEYAAMFGLTKRDLSGNILDCGSGPSSFNCDRESGNLAGVIEEISKEFDCRITAVEYEFQKGADRMFKISQKNNRDRSHLWA